MDRNRWINRPIGAQAAAARAASVAATDRRPITSGCQSGPVATASRCTILVGWSNPRMAAHDDKEIAALCARLNALEAERSTLTERLKGLQSQAAARSSLDSASASVNGESKAAEKIALFRRLFAGRSDVFPLRWENRNTGMSGYAPACANEWVRGVCGKPQVKCGDCPNQAFLVVSDQVIAKHLRGVDDDRSFGAGYVAGVYPVLMDGSCRFVAADFDGEHWVADALAYLETCRLKTVPAALERSRSGEGGHVWIFFSQPIPARDARQLGAVLLTETLERRPELGFNSYDRLFPSQDTVPKGGFGNLIALPLQRRARDYGNSVFVDNSLHAYRDQWAFLASLGRLTPEKLSLLNVTITLALHRIVAARTCRSSMSGSVSPAINSS
jgi:hypothetical protein